MGEALIVGIISAIVSLIGIFVSSKATRDAVTNKLDKQQGILNAEINHIKEDMKEMKTDIKSHNSYGLMFSENIPALKERLTAANDKLNDLGERLGKLENNR